MSNAKPLTGDEIRAAIRHAHNMSGPSDATQPAEYVLAGALALLSKLRAPVADERAACPTDVCQAGKADGVLCANDECDRANGVRPASAPVADERAAYTDPLSDFQEGQWWVKELDELARAPGATHDQKRAVAVVHHMLRSAALASAPASCAHQFHFFGDQKERLCNRCNVVESKANAPVADETYTDENGTVWTRPTAWAYAQVCKARDKWQAAASAPVAGEAKNYPGDNVADRLDSMADDQPPGSQAQSDLYAAATIWRKHIAHHAAPQASEAVRDALKTCGSRVFKALAAIARADGPDTRKADDPELIYREPVMDEAVRIRQAYDELSSALSAQPELSSGAPNGRKRTAAERRAPMVERVYGTGATAQPAQKEQSE